MWYDLVLMNVKILVISYVIIPVTGLSIYTHVCDGRISIVNEGLNKS